MSIDREDLLLAFRALKRGHLSAGDVRRAFKRQAALPVRKPLMEVLRTELRIDDEALGPLRLSDHYPDPRADRALLDDLSKMLVEMDLTTSPEFEKVAGSLVPPSAATEYAPLPVPQILGEYEVRWEMGRSENSVVFRGHHARHGDVTLKVFRPGMTPPGFKARAVDPHPGLARIIEAFEAGGLTVVPMEFVEGEALSKLVGARKIAPRPAFELLHKAARTLADLHAKGFTHGSLGTSDLLVLKGEVRLKDFGGVEGTVPGDLRAFAAVLYEAATGVPPWAKGESESAPPPAAIAVNKALEPDADRIVARALSMGYSSMADLADDLGRFVRREPLSAPAVARSGSKVAVLVGIAAILLAAGVGWAIFIRPKKEKPAEIPKEEPAPERKKPPPKEDVPKEEPKKDPPKEEPKPDGDLPKPLNRDEQLAKAQEALDLLHRGDYQAAEKLATEVLKRGPKLHWAHLCAAQAQFEQADYDRALANVEEALKLKPDSPDEIILRFQCFLMRGEVRRSFEDLKARFGSRTKDVNSTILDLGKKMKDEPKEGMLPFERGVLLAYKPDHNYAEREFTRAIALGRRPALHFRAHARAALGQFKDALADVKAFLDEFPQSAGAEEAKALKADLEKKVK